jgi:hypothetical protein
MLKRAKGGKVRGRGSDAAAYDWRSSSIAPRRPATARASASASMRPRRRRGSRATRTPACSSHSRGSRVMEAVVSWPGRSERAMRMRFTVGGACHRERASEGAAAHSCTSGSGAGGVPRTLARRLYERGPGVKVTVVVSGAPAGVVVSSVAHVSIAPSFARDRAKSECSSGGACPKRAVTRLDEKGHLPERTAGCG